MANRPYILVYKDLLLTYHNLVSVPSFFDLKVFGYKFLWFVVEPTQLKHTSQIVIISQGTSRGENKT